MRCLMRALLLLASGGVATGCGSTTATETVGGEVDPVQQATAPGGEAGGASDTRGPAGGDGPAQAEGRATDPTGDDATLALHGQDAGDDTPAAARDARPWAGCAVVHLGFDLRALPHGTRGNGVDMYVRSRAQDLADLAGAPEMRMAHIPGTGVMWGYFDAADERAALSRCERAVVRYLEDPPMLPVIREPAVLVIEACRPCAPPAEAADAAL